jgi:hypothetical protein
MRCGDSIAHSFSRLFVARCFRIRSLPAYSELDLDVIHALRSWSHSQLPHRLMAPLVAVDKYTRTFSQLDSRGFFDFIVALVHVDPSGAGIDASPKTNFTTPIAYVWDGTDLPAGTRLQRAVLPPSTPLPVAPGTTPGKFDAEKHKPAVTPSFGTVMPLAYHPAAQAWFNVPLSSAAPTFVHLRNIVFECDRDGAFYLKFQQKSKIYPLEATDPKVERMMGSAERRVHEEARV